LRLFAPSNKIDLLIKRMVLLSQFVFKETGMLKVSNVKTRRFKEDVVAVAVSAKYIAVVLFGPKVKV
jgi:hypothetical protein